MVVLHTSQKIQLLILLLGFTCAGYSEQTVFITHDLPYLDVRHGDKIIRIERNSEPGNMAEPDFTITSRPCPPYCIQPIQLAAGVETIAELEVLAYLKQMTEGNKTILLIDSREPEWLQKGMIPGAINLPWQKLHSQTAKANEVKEILQFKFGAVYINGLWQFQSAKTLIFYCNGPWCGQSPTNIHALLNLGYPADKIKWYRGGMQNWKLFGLTTVMPKQK